MASGIEYLNLMEELYMKIVLLYGGQSAEHDISLISAHNIMQSIMYNFYEVQPVYITNQG